MSDISFVQRVIDAITSIFVPFTGADQDVNIGVFDFISKGIKVSHADDGGGGSTATVDAYTGTFQMSTSDSMVRVFNMYAVPESNIMVQIYGNPTGWGGGAHLEVERDSGFFQVALFIAGSAQPPPVNITIGFVLVNNQ